jgi:ParB family chromosome partitioning protein
MHPADEFDAFKAMIDEGKSIEDVVARFGVSPLTVQRRLKLAALSPKLLALYRQDGINLDQLMALALSDDHAVQEAAWFGVPHWEQDAAAIRRRLTAGEIEAARSGLVRFVGIESYEAAGGVVRRDLFDSEQSRFIADPPLLERLAAEKLEAIAVLVRDESWGWVEVRLELTSQALRQFTPADFDLRKPTTEERTALTELTRRARELKKEGERLSDDKDGWAAAEAIDLEEQDIAVRQRAIQIALRTWTPDVKARAGAIVTVSRGGDAEVVRGLLREDDRKALAAAQAKARRTEHRSPGNGSGIAVADETSGGEDDDASTGDEPASKRGEYSEALTRRLAAHRTLAMQVVLSRNVPVALASLAHALVQRVFGEAYGRTGPALQIGAQTSEHALTTAADDLKSGSAWLAWQTARDEWRQRLPQDRGAWFAWLLELPQDDLMSLLAFCAASTVNALPSAGTAFEADRLARAIALDMADWWQASSEGFLHHVSKAQIVQALKEAGPDLARNGVEGTKKDVLVNAALTRLAGTRWLPAPLRPPPT